MKKNVLSLSIAAMIGGLGLARQAKPEVIEAEGELTVLRVTDAGVGHNLLVPYFNPQHGNMSVFNVIQDGTARVRFRGSPDGADSFDFLTFLGPGPRHAAPVAVTASTNLQP